MNAATVSTKGERSRSFDLHIPWLLGAVTVALCLSLAGSASAEEGSEARYGTVHLGPRVGGGIGLASGPRGGYYAGLELTYATPRFFYYDVEVGFLHLLPTTVEVGPTLTEAPEGEEPSELVPEHDADVTGLYGIPITLEVGLRIPFGNVALRLGVGFGAMVTVQTLESFGNDEQEVVASFCFRPELGLDVGIGGGALRLDLFYLWQDAEFEITGGSHDVDSLMITIGYGWRIVG